MAQRLYVAQLLADNTTYNTIAIKTGASTATISRVKGA
jgi:TrpR-related protein YerC/YecD